MRYAILGICLGLIGCEPVEKLDTQRKPSSSPVAERTTARRSTEREGESAKVAGQTPSETPKASAEEVPEQKQITVEKPASTEEEKKEDPPEQAPPIPESFKPLNKAKNLFFEKAGDVRRVHLMAEICLREGPLEVLLCKLNTKEHESILHVDADAREIHFALIAAGAQPGTPVKFVPKYEGATGTKIKVTLTYCEKGKVKTGTAQEWIKDKKTGKDMPHDWVFAGSKFFRDPERANAPPYYMANNGEIISLANFPDSMMDLPVKSPKEALDLIYEINTPKIPPLKTPVLITFEPVLEKK
ncbi:YdjY domain-containing protein [Zavarzinella formosa]|uniref:YdjY domain-containing protein n=1 Tax=Zavarzinella formosa TaxID=360055 RepID=UPI0002E490E3|nr:YdjY domain-containing protein [Zavarzinella formosa]